MEEVNLEGFVCRQIIGPMAIQSHSESRQPFWVHLSGQKNFPPRKLSLPSHSKMLHSYTKETSKASSQGVS